MHINWRRFIMVDSPYRRITLGIWREEIAVSVSCLQLSYNGNCCVCEAISATSDRVPEEACEPDKRDELAAPHVWMAPAWQEIIWRAAQRSLAVMCPACWCSPGGLLALMGYANRVLIIRTGSMSQ